MAWLELDGAVNVRDVGGIAAADGRQIAAGRLLRGDDLNDLSPADVDLLVTQIGLTTVIDLRSPAEVRDRGPGPLSRAGRVRHVHHSLLPELGLADDVAGAMEERIDRARARYRGDLRCGLYLGYLEERPAQVAAAVRDIARAGGPVMVHCAAGKDRTGVTIGVLLSAVGVPRDAALADYDATNEVIDEVVESLSEMFGGPEGIARIPLAMRKAQPGALADVLDRLDRDFGGAAGWLRSRGMDDTELDLLRHRLVAP